MADDQLEVLLSRLERPARPDPAFADALFEQLISESGLRGRKRFGRFGAWPWLRSDHATVARLAWLAVIAALLIAFSALLLGPGGRPSLLSIVPSRSPSPSPAASVVVPSPTAPATDAPTAPPIESGVMGIGDLAPDWSGRLLDGETFLTEELRGRPAALFLWCLCIAGPQARVFLEAASARSDAMSLVFVSMDMEGTTRGLVDWLDVSTPVVHDPDMALLSAWGISGWPALVLLRADGTLSGIQPATFGKATLDAILDALAAGDLIPEPDPPEPVPTDDQGNLPLTTVLEVGQVPPELVGPALGGGEQSTIDAAGRPSAVLFWRPPRADGSPQDDSPLPEALIAEVERRSGGIELQLVAEGEPAPGDAGGYLERLGADVPVIFDWAGELQDRWGLVFTPTLVLLDADGRVAGIVGSEGIADPAAALDLIDPGGATSPAPSASPQGS